MRNREAGCLVALDEGKGRAGYGFIEAERHEDRPREGRLAGAEIAFQRDRIAGLQKRGNPRAQAAVSAGLEIGISRENGASFTADLLARAGARLNAFRCLWWGGPSR